MTAIKPSARAPFTHAPAKDCCIFQDPNFPELDLLKAARNNFDLLLKINGIESTKQQCVYGSHFLIAILNASGTMGAFAEVCGGGLTEDTGVLTPQGTIEKHMWVRYCKDNQSWFLDITADQFGYADLVYGLEEDLSRIFLADPQEDTNLLLAQIRKDPFFDKLAKSRGADNQSGVTKVSGTRQPKSGLSL